MRISALAFMVGAVGDVMCWERRVWVVVMGDGT
jgi:hypothetical protein